MDVSVNVTTSGAVPDVGLAENPAPGPAPPTVIYPAMVSALLPAAFVAVSVTAYVPLVVYV